MRRWTIGCLALGIAGLAAAQTAHFPATLYQYQAPPGRFSRADVDQMGREITAIEASLGENLDQVTEMCRDVLTRHVAIGNNATVDKNDQAVIWLEDVVTASDQNVIGATVIPIWKLQENFTGPPDERGFGSLDLFPIFYPGVLNPDAGKPLVLGFGASAGIGAIARKVCDSSPPTSCTSDGDCGGGSCVQTRFNIQALAGFNVRSPALANVDLRYKVCSGATTLPCAVDADCAPSSGTCTAYAAGRNHGINVDDQWVKGCSNDVTRVCTVDGDCVSPGTCTVVQENNAIRTGLGDVSLGGRMALRTLGTLLGTTPSVRAGNVFKTGNTSATTITDLTSGTAGQQVTVIFADANTGMAQNSALHIAAAITAGSGTVNDTITMLHDGTAWFEVSRSVN
jgi:hypothetical protein